MRTIISALAGVTLGPLLVVLFITFLVRTDSLWLSAAGTLAILVTIAGMAGGMINRWIARREQKRALETLVATALVAEALEKDKVANEADELDALGDDVLDDAPFVADDGFGWNDEDEILSSRTTTRSSRMAGHRRRSDSAATSNAAQWEA